MVEDDGDRAAADGLAQPVDVLPDVAPDLDVPPEGRHHVAHLGQRLDGDTAGEPVLHARAAHPGRVHRGELFCRGPDGDAGDTAQVVGTTAEGGEQAPVVLPVGAGLDEDAEVAAQVRQVPGVVGDVHGGRPVGGAPDQRGAGDGVVDEDVAVVVDRARRQHRCGHRAASPCSRSSTSTGSRWVRNRG